MESFGGPGWGGREKGSVRGTLIMQNEPNYPGFRAENEDSAGKRTQTKPIGPNWGRWGASGVAEGPIVRNKANFAVSRVENRGGAKEQSQLGRGLAVGGWLGLRCCHLYRTTSGSQFRKGRT